MAEETPDTVAAASVPAANKAGKAGVVESIELGPKVTLLLEHDALIIHGTLLVASSTRLRITRTLT